MTPEERFERIERSLAAASDAITATAQLAARNEEALERLLRTMGKLATAQELLQASLGVLIQSVSLFVQSSEESRKRLEASMEALIRAITTERSNGKGPERS